MAKREMGAVSGDGGGTENHREYSVMMPMTAPWPAPELAVMGVMAAAMPTTMPASMPVSIVGTMTSIAPNIQKKSVDASHGGYGRFRRERAAATSAVKSHRQYGATEMARPE